MPFYECYISSRARSSVTSTAALKHDSLQYPSMPRQCCTPYTNHRKGVVPVPKVPLSRVSGKDSENWKAASTAPRPVPWLCSW
eukprot:scaffold72742_cov21-Tisochrysis_lutea.AAC.3